MPAADCAVAWDDACRSALCFEVDWTAACEAQPPAVTPTPAIKTATFANVRFRFSRCIARNLHLELPKSKSAAQHTTLVHAACAAKSLQKPDSTQNTQAVQASHLRNLWDEFSLIGQKTRAMRSLVAVAETTRFAYAFK